MTKPRFRFAIGGLRCLARRFLAPALAVAVLQGCTDLDENPTSVITPESFFQTEAEILGSLASVYNPLSATGGIMWNYFNLSEVSSDELIVPTRGSDWFDNGRWLEIHKQTWTANSPSGLSDMNGAWNDLFTGIARANVLLAALETVEVDGEVGLVAELRTLRAVYYYLLQDLFGGVPIATDVELTARERNTRAEVFQFISDELTAARADLPVTRPASDQGRMTKGAADAVLANLYLNAGVFTSDAPDATSYNSCASVDVNGVNACQAAIDAANAVINGPYSLANDWPSIFTADNSGSPEHVLVGLTTTDTELGMSFVMRTLHYNSLPETPWNGFAALGDVYRAFDADDMRREAMLEGRQTNLITGELIDDRQGNALFFTIDIADETQATEGEGTRMYKYPVDLNRNAQYNGNDFVYFRLGEMYLIRAEASFELNGGGLGDLNTLRERVFDPDEPLTTINRDVILAERLFELQFEAKRRQDLIRFGQFTAAWEFKAASEPFRVLMPIAQPQLDANPLLVQNPGY